MKEEEIRPKKVFDEYLRLAAIDAELYFGASVREPLHCPACNAKGKYVFDKHGFSYEECLFCQTIFVSPRPPIKDFFRYYKESDSAKYFATTFYRETAKARRNKLWRPKAKMIFDVLKYYGVDKYYVFDIGGGYGIFAEEYQNLSGVPVTVIEPGPDSAAICREKGLPVIESFLENINHAQLPHGRKVFVSFELFEHLHDCNYFLLHLVSLMQKGDIFIFTTLSSVGVDIQSLWNESKAISLQHLNLFNPKSIKLLVERAGLRILQVKTPGKLDFDILENNLNLVQSRFFVNLLKNISSEEKKKWQKFIASQGFSSHMLVVCECI